VNEVERDPGQSSGDPSSGMSRSDDGGGPAGWWSGHRPGGGASQGLSPGIAARPRFQVLGAGASLRSRDRVRPGPRALGLPQSWRRVRPRRSRRRPRAERQYGAAHLYPYKARNGRSNRVGDGAGEIGESSKAPVKRISLTLAGPDRATPRAHSGARGGRRSRWRVEHRPCG